MEKTIKVSEKNYLRLLRIAAELQKERGERVSFDDALDNMDVKKENEGNIMDFAGAWSDMSDKEAKEFLDITYKERKIKSRRLQ